MYVASVHPHDPARLKAFRIALFGTCLAVLSIGTATPARASCGDWLDHSATSGQVDANEHDPLASEPYPAPHRRGPLPCNGPQCQGVPQAPIPAVPPAPVSPQTEYGFVAGNATPLAAHQRGYLLVSPSLGASDGYPRRIDRPPRA